jgi:choline dehydrogenase-like flavoprotein
MGLDPATSVTDTNGRFHHVANAFCADQALFVTVGSVNPTLTGLTLARKVSEAVIARALGQPVPP